MKFIYVILLGLFMMPMVSKAQSGYCSVVVSPLNATVCPGDSVLVTAVANLLNNNQAYNFNFGNVPPGWSVGGSGVFTAPCGPSPSNTPYYWASTAGSGIPFIETADFDITCGGQVIFDMVYSQQGGSTPCEGPDQQNEGVAFQYSLNGGTTWVTIEYYQPDGQTFTSIQTGATSVAFGATPFTTWGTFTVTIPTIAQSPSTRFRWFQPTSSGACCDNWGLDNIIINATGTPCGATAVLDWSNGVGNVDSFYVTPIGDSSFTVDVYDTLGNYQCTSSAVNISVYPNTMTYSLVDTAYSYCPTTNPLVQVTNFANSIAPYTVYWTELMSANNPINLPTGGAEHDTIVFHVDVMDGCNYIHPDSVVLIVNKLLSIDSLVTYDATACHNDGTVVAFVSGLTVTSGQPFYNWTGPGAGNPAFINSTVWQNRASGWYYFTVTDNVCTDSDSVFLDQLPPPIANLSADPLIGCAPFDVTFTNTSENATNYAWNFGNGNSTTTSNLNGFTITYTNPATITLIAYTTPDCADTATVTIGVSVCGCTDPSASNFNPLASTEDGSCTYPEPIVEMPNVFTPNGDGSNDVFKLNVKNYSNIELTIVNRWGGLMYSGSGLTPGWDGKTSGGGEAANGVYFYKFVVSNYNGSKTVEGQGFIELFR